MELPAAEMCGYGLVLNVLKSATENIWNVPDEERKAQMLSVLKFYIQRVEANEMSEEDLFRFVEKHMWYIRRKKTKGKESAFIPPATRTEKEELLRKDALTKKEVSRLFEVDLREVQRWVAQHKLETRWVIEGDKPQNKVARASYLRFARNSTKYDELPEMFNHLMEKSTRPTPQGK